jgi:arabinose-5-phosphate isomerase
MKALKSDAGGAPAARDAMATARDVLAIEAQAITDLIGMIDQQFARAVELIMERHGRVVVSGMGKSGHVARKIASTLASTGTPAFFVHPAEASHGDLGMVTRDDVLIALSNSGESAELLAIVPILKRQGAKLIAMTGNAQSTLAREADIHLYAGARKEACPLNLAPTASTTAALALGDALAVALLKSRGFTADDFARSHPGGKLGRRLLLYVRDVMHSGARIPLVPETASLREALLEMTSKGLGMTGVLDTGGKLAGIFTDGDLRRTLNKEVDVYNAKISDVMTRNPKTCRADQLAAEIVQLMEKHNINGLMVVDADQRVLGALNMGDLLRAGVV